MIDLDQWRRGNDEYLAAALEWLRLRLRRLAEAAPIAASAALVVEPEGRRLFRRPSPAAPRPPARVTPEQIARAAQAMNAAADMDPPPALPLLGSQFDLTTFEREVLLLCAAVELDTRVAALCAAAQIDAQRPFPTFALALTLFDEPEWNVLSPDRPLRYWRLIEINQPGAQPLTTSALRADERVLNYLKGLNYLDDRLGPLLMPFDEAATAELAPSQVTAVREAVHRLEQGAAVVQLVGPDPLSRQAAAQAASAVWNRRLYRLPVALLPGQAAELETLARLWQRESVFLPVALFLDDEELGDGAAGDAPAAASALRRFLARGRGVFFLGAREVRSGLGSPAAIVEVNKPTPVEQAAIWAEAIGEEQPDNGASPNDGTAASLAGQFNLNGATIRRIAASVLDDTSLSSDAPPPGPSLHDRLWDGCLQATRPRLEMLAQRLDARATWDDIVLPDEEAALIHRIADQVRQRNLVYDGWGFRAKMNRGLGISALFAGESGTGKTMAAEVIANELRLDLYRIDLSAVVSKYIGETEKNLRRLFDAAEDGGAILFFDEADALFGKRSEVKDSHDRYANIEINYLLQRMEAYHGLAVLATNMKSALDTAFMRRLRFIVNFPFPGHKERQAIWANVFPPQTPVITDAMIAAAEERAAGGEPGAAEELERLRREKLDPARLARLSLTGGSIHNVALGAAFLAARAGGEVTTSRVWTAARAEFRKLGRPVNEAEFK